MRGMPFLVAVPIVPRSMLLIDRFWGRNRVHSLFRTDLNCGMVYSKALHRAISRNLTSEALLDASIERSVGLLMQVRNRIRTDLRSTTGECLSMRG